MKKAVFFSLLLFSNIFSCPLTFQSCLAKIKNFKVVEKDSLYIPLKDGNLLIYNPKKIKDRQNYDPFLNLYIIKHYNYEKFPFLFGKDKNKELASINEEIICGSIKKEQTGLDDFAKFSKKAFVPGLVLNSCCELFGINTKKGVISKEYIKHFIKYGPNYGDVGIRVKDINNSVVVVSKNPFILNGFEVGDKILKIDGKEVKNSSDFYKKILFSKIGKTCRFDVKRENDNLMFFADIYRRKGGGFVSDSFLESYDIYLDRDLKILSSTKLSNFKKGDKILMINSQKVKNEKDIRKVLSKVKDDIVFLINREGFEFFLHLRISPK